MKRRVWPVPIDRADDVDPRTLNLEHLIHGETLEALASIGMLPVAPVHGRQCPALRRSGGRGCADCAELHDWWHRNRSIVETESRLFPWSEWHPYPAEPVELSAAEWRYRKNVADVLRARRLELERQRRARFEAQIARIDSEAPL